MDNILVAYFSATGRTAKVARKKAAELGADTYEIQPVVKYEKADLNWMDKKSRSTICYIRRDEGYSHCSVMNIR